jgi:hypothetical protein
VHRAVSSGRVILRVAPLIAIAGLMVVPCSARARSTRVLAFGVPPNTAYEVTVNGANHATITSSRTGTLSHRFDVDSGDRVAFSTANLAPPAPPLLTSVVDGGAGCAVATWLPSGDPTVVGYVLYAGTRSVAAGEATAYDAEVDAATATSTTICPPAPGVNYVAVRARNYAGMLSAYSAELTITTVAVLFTAFDATVEDRAVHLSWIIEADEAVEGLRVYRSEGNAPAIDLVEGLLPPQTREFVDLGTRGGASYEYVLAARLEHGDEIRSAPVTVETPASALALEQNAPNPFNPSTRIPFTLDGRERVAIRVYDVRGALVATLHDGDLDEGRHEARWDGRDKGGRPVASGIYICTLTAGKRKLTRKMTLIK